jgi:hypothetical protein
MPPFRLDRLIVASAPPCCRSRSPAARRCPRRPPSRQARRAIARRRHAARRPRARRTPHRAPRSGTRRRAPPSPATAARPPRRAAAAQAAQSQKPFADVVKDAKEYDGLLRVWQKDERCGSSRARPARPAALLQVEHQPGHRRRPHLRRRDELSDGRRAGRRVPQGRQNIQLIAKNTKYTAKPGTPEARAVAAGSRTACSAAAPIAAQPHPTRKS